MSNFASPQTPFTGTNGTTATTTPVINLPSGAPLFPGSLLLVFVRNAAGGTITAPNEGTDWIQLFEDSSDASNDTTALFWRRTDGTEGATVTFTFGTSGKFAALAMLFLLAADPRGQPPEFSTLVTGTSDIPDPDTITPSGDTKDYIVLWLGGWEGEQTSPPAGAPTNYGSPAGADSGTAGLVATNCRVAVAYRAINAATENPPSWTISAADDWTATAVVIYPTPFLPEHAPIYPDTIDEQVEIVLYGHQPPRVG